MAQEKQLKISEHTHSKLKRLGQILSEKYGFVSMDVAIGAAVEKLLLEIDPSWLEENPHFTHLRGKPLMDSIVAKQFVAKKGIEVLGWLPNPEEGRE